jgi:hypothetical protein
MRRESDYGYLFESDVTRRNLLSRNLPGGAKKNTGKKLTR